MNKNMNFLKNEIHNYDVLLCRTKWKPLQWDTYILPQAIRFFTKSKYNHVAIVTEYMGEKVILEAVANGFRPTKSLDEWLDEYPEVREFAIMRYKYPFEREVVESRLRSILYNKYDFKSTLLEQFRYYLNLYLFGVDEPKWKGKTGEVAKNEINCSEAIAYAYEMKEWWKVIPKDIYYSNLFDKIYETRK